MNNLQIFENKEIGQVRTAEENGQAMFCLVDLCNILDIKNSRDCRSRLSDSGVVTIDTLTNGGNQKLTYVNETNMYKVIFQSRKASAEKFTDWVTSEILPSIRKSGTYTVDKRLSEKEMLRIQLNMIDEVEQRVENLENNMVIDYGQQQVLKNVVNATVTVSLGGKSSPAYKEISKIVFSECNKDFQNYFKVNSRNNTPKIKFDEAISYVSEWQPCTNTKLLINICNAQLTIAV